MESQSIGGTGTISTFDGKTVMMEMEIQFSKGRVDRILVFYGDDPTQIAIVSDGWYHIMMTMYMSSESYDLS